MSAGTIIGVAFGVVFILVVGALYTYLEFEKERVFVLSLVNFLFWT